DGTLFLAFSDADEAELEERWRWQHAAGLPIERLGSAEVLRLEPAISPAVRGGLRFPEDHQVESGRFALALWSAAARAGAAFRSGAAVRALLHDGRRARGVVLADRASIAAGAVVVAAGSWAGMLEQLPRPLPVFPVHGQLLALEALPPLFRHVIDSPRCYLVPRAEGRIIAGTTVERIGFSKAVTPAGMMGIMHGALEIAPALAETPLTDTWSGLRPGTPDGLPILGRDPTVENLFYATGHFRNGILLAPITAEALAELVLSGRSTIDLAPFGVERFDADR
ncbi:MAG TPA: FAD-dependent oxidoreductase, partial [Longimicrobiaceae bacterium]|nr:FAD-dependent oxidoreductase [Longimicrobiaceae bacterium]